MKQQVIFLCIFLLILLSYLVYNGYFHTVSINSNQKVNVTSTTKPTQTKVDPRFTMVYKNQQKNDSKIYVLFWSNYFDVPNWGQDATLMAEDYLKKYSCPETRCVFTHDPNMLPNITDFDAVLFNIWGKEFSLPKFRSPYQLYIMNSKETPLNIQRDLSLEDNLINLTMTYRLDSDILFPYGEVLDAQTGHVIAPALNIKWRKPEDDFKDQRILDAVKSKTVMASWLASHCDTFSNRSYLIKKLQEHGIDVKSYGKCGSLNCAGDCWNEALQAKFYMAFENSLCIDYVTEKLYKMTYSDIIPVVYSGADLNRFMPPRSYIDANTFKTAEDLAKYLKFLSDNPEEFVKYFWWKKYYFVRQQGYITGAQVCTICQKLHEQNIFLRTQYYPSVKLWFGEGACKNSTIQF